MSFNISTKPPGKMGKSKRRCRKDFERAPRVAHTIRPEENVNPLAGTDSHIKDPVIELSERPVGRATFAAIMNEVASDDRERELRNPFTTLDYEDAPLEHRNIYKIMASSQKFCDSPDALPEVSVGETRGGLETMAIIEQELRREPNAMTQGTALQSSRYGQEEIPVEKQQKRSAETCTVLELYTFIILDDILSVSSTEQQRLDFVQKRLWHRLPPGGLSSIHRIDLRPADEHAMMMRIWCKVPRIL